MSDNNSDKNYKKTTLSMGDLIEDVDGDVHGQNQKGSGYNAVSADTDDLDNLISNIDSDIMRIMVRL